jgi:hypothetical protein
MARVGAAARRPAFDAAAKVGAILRVLRGEPAPDVARDLGVDAATLDAWRADFLAGAAARLGGRRVGDIDRDGGRPPRRSKRRR